MLTGLAYLGIASRSADAWPTFATEVLGAALAESGRDGSVRVKVDDAAWRIEIIPAASDRFGFVGWTVADESDLASLADRLRAAGVEVHTGDDALATQRNVSSLLWFEDPWGFRHELVTGQVHLPGSFRPGRALSGFVTGAQGLGHIVITVPDLDEAHAFFTSVLGFGFSDRIVTPEAVAHFYHLGSRHHSLAIAQNASFTGLHHLMLEVGDINDVGTAYDICQGRKLPLRKGIGRHTNDQMVSFYVTSPSLFHIEYGYGGIQVEDGWLPKTYTQNSVWGHRSPADASTGPGIPR